MRFPLELLTPPTMKKRIGLFASKSKIRKGAATTNTCYVEVDDVAELTAKLSDLGATKLGLLCRDRLGATSLEGKMFPASDLTQAHLDWLVEKPKEFQTRGLFLETK